MKPILEGSFAKMVTVNKVQRRFALPIPMSAESTSAWSGQRLGIGSGQTPVRCPPATHHAFLVKSVLISKMICQCFPLQVMHRDWPKPKLRWTTVHSDDYQKEVYIAAMLLERKLVPTAIGAGEDDDNGSSSQNKTNRGC